MLIELGGRKVLSARQTHCQIIDSKRAVCLDSGADAAGVGGGRTLENVGRKTISLHTVTHESRLTTAVVVDVVTSVADDIACRSRLVV
ncbi:hypothetical protein EVAR_23864_1 [Eumeta japonica]|uniref:Uncharacterized protein n=1 Tax=Eumeta variegata TaxID=151549 RepID=A0A4C1V3W6_EUMVA|nr:hypothetical protein EVAR_23864_1 [Eumeta japonica]